MKTKSKLSIFALQQRLSRPGATAVLAVFTPGYLLYLITLLVINMQKGWFAVQEPQERSPFNEIYTFAYYFKSNGYSISDLTNSTTPFLVRSEIVFLVSLFALVLVLTIAHVKMNRGSDTIKRLSILSPSVKIMQWASDFVYILGVWLSHLVVIFLFHMLYMHFAPAELAYPHSLYALSAGERYLYMLFPVLNPISFIRMLLLIFAVSFLPSFISAIIDDISEYKKINMSGLFVLILLVGAICWGCFASDHIGSILACAIAAVGSVFLASIIFQEGGSDADAEESI